MQDTLEYTRSLEKLIHLLGETSDFKPSEVVKAIKQAGITIEELLPWADFNHPNTDSYGRKLVYKDPRFEIMVMSWNPGDFSAIHDHGHTQWGAVQIFGEAEHATFRVDDYEIHTLARWMVEPGDIIGVSHSLTHQMGNPGNEPFLSLHVYGCRNEHEHITGESRIYDLENSTIQRTSGGVFFALESDAIEVVEKGPQPDFPTRLRHMVELSNRLLKMTEEDRKYRDVDLDQVLKKTLDPAFKSELLDYLRTITDEEQHQTDSPQWHILTTELKAAGDLQNSLRKEHHGGDQFHRYNEVYDELICKPSMDSFMLDYWDFFAGQADIDLSTSKLISLGCGTGFMEEHLNEKYDFQDIYGIDISPAMIEVARKRLRADVGDVLTLEPELGIWDIAYSGLNVFQYLDFHRLEEAIEKTAAILRSGGYFLGDFISPDHIRWYPNVMYGNRETAISLRSPKLIEKEGRMFQESEIINLNFGAEEMEVNNAGKHRRYLPPMNRVRNYFENAFGAEVKLYDALSRKEIPDWADSCPSTRYFVIARKS